MALRTTLAREARVAFSPRAQSVRFRVVKWIVIVAIGAWLWSTPYFWPTLGGALAVSLSLHFLWRWKTRNWTRPWGGWNDVDGAGEP
jgi:hypothetical protein